MDASAYILLALLTFCGLGCGISDLGAAEDTEGLTADSAESRVFPLPSYLKREWITMFPDQKYRHVGIGKRTLDFFRFHSKIGKRLDLLTLIKSNLHQSRDILRKSYRPNPNERSAYRFGSPLAPVRRSLRTRNYGLRLANRRMSGVYRGSRSQVDPMMLMLGLGK